MTTEMVTSQSLRIRHSGDRAVLVEVPSLEHAFGLRQTLRESQLPGVEDIVVSASAVLIIATSPKRLPELKRFVQLLDELPSQPITGKQIQIPVVYDGEDLGSLAQLLGHSPEAFVGWHSQRNWTAAFTGFAPGFVYLVSDSGVLVPRKDTPRSTVPAGSLAMAESYSAVYPRASAGGWQLIGRTDAALWDETRRDPALIQPGDVVKFVPVHAEIHSVTRPQNTVAAAPTEFVQPTRAADLVVESAGTLSTFQDLGRFGKSNLGVGPGGAMDKSASLSANQLVGNTDSSAVIETFGAGISLVANTGQVLAVTGAASTLLIETVENSDSVSAWEPRVNEPFVLLAGQRLRIIESLFGSWSYIGVRGGFDAPSVLGSKSRDMHSGLGPAPLTHGSELFVGSTDISMVVGSPLNRAHEVEDVVTLRVIPGPRAEWFTADSVNRFFNEPWTATHQVSRTAVRLNGVPLERSRLDELQSEGVVRGSIQVPSDGQPLIFGADYPVTGGYPVIGVVVNDDLAKAAQIGPSTVVRFQRVDLTSDADVSKE